MSHDAAGNWVTVWASHADLGETIGTDWDILFSRSTDGGQTWTDAVPLHADAYMDSGDDFSGGHYGREEAKTPQMSPLKTMLFESLAARSPISSMTPIQPFSLLMRRPSEMELERFHHMKTVLRHMLPIGQAWHDLLAANRFPQKTAVGEQTCILGHDHRAPCAHHHTGQLGQGVRCLP